MLNLCEKKLQDTIVIRGRERKLNTDFRIWLKFIIACEKKESFNLQDLFLEPKPKIVFEDDLKEFLMPKNEVPKKSNTGNNENIVSFEFDSDFIYCEFMKKYNIDLLTAEMHWHKFLTLFNGILIDYKDIISYRNYDGKDKEYLKMKKIWSLPTKVDEEMKKAKAYFDSLDKT